MPDQRYDHDMYRHTSRRHSYIPQTNHHRRRSISPSDEYISQPTYSSSDYIHRPESSRRLHYKHDHRSALDSVPLEPPYRSHRSASNPIYTPEPSYRLHYYTRPSYHRSSSSDYISRPEESRHDYIAPRAEKSRSSRNGIRVRFSHQPSYAETDSNDSIAKDAGQDYRFLDEDEYDMSDVESVGSNFYRGRREAREYAASDIESLRSHSGSGQRSRSASVASRSTSEVDDEDIESVGSIGTRGGSDYTSVRGGEDGMGSDVYGASLSGDDGGVYMDGYKYFSDSDDDGDDDDDDEY